MSTGFEEITWKLAFRIVMTALLVGLPLAAIAAFVVLMLQSALHQPNLLFYFGIFVLPLIFAWAFRFVLRRRQGAYKVLFVGQLSQFRRPLDIAACYMLALQWGAKTALMMLPLIFLILVPLGRFLEVRHKDFHEPFALCMVLIVCFAGTWSLRRTARKGIWLHEEGGLAKFHLKMTKGN